MSKKWLLLGAVVVVTLLAAGGILAHNNWEGENEVKNGTGEAEEVEEVTYEIEGDEIIISWGEKPTGGYAISIEDIDIEENDLVVYYSLRSPSEDEMVTQAITYPEDSAEIPGDFEDVKLELVEHKK